MSLLSSLVRPKQGPVGTESLTIHMVRGSTDKDPLGGSTDKDAQAGSTVKDAQAGSTISPPTQ